MIKLKLWLLFVFWICWQYVYRWFGLHVFQYFHLWCALARIIEVTAMWYVYTKWQLSQWMWHKSMTNSLAQIHWVLFVVSVEAHELILSWMPKYYTDLATWWVSLSAREEIDHFRFLLYSLPHSTSVSNQHVTMQHDASGLN